MKEPNAFQRFCFIEEERQKKEYKKGVKVKVVYVLCLLVTGYFLLRMVESICTQWVTGLY